MKPKVLIFVAFIAISLVLSACNVNKQTERPKNTTADTLHDVNDTQVDDINLEDNSMPADIGSLDEIPVDVSIPE